jgi:hypothetical protein
MVRALAGLLLLLAAQPVFAQPDDWDGDHRHRRGDGARILVLKDYRLPAGETAHGPVIVLGGAATIDGHADDDVVVLGGRVRVGPQAVIDGEVVTVGGEADVDPQARIHGGVDATAVRFPDLDGNWGPLPRGWFAGFALVATVFRLLLVLIVTSMLTLVAPGWVRRIAWRASDGMASSAAIGLACQVAFIPALVTVVVALAISIVGIPLIGAVPFLIAAAGLAATAGFAAVAARVGARVRGTTVEESRALFIDMVIGVASISAVSLFARFAAFGILWDNPVTWSVSAAGLLIEYVVWTIGIGAACASLLANWKKPRMAPIAPPPPVTI